MNGKWLRIGWLAASVLISSMALAEVYLLNGMRVEGEVHDEDGYRTICTDEGMCMELPDDAIRLDEGESEIAPAPIETAPVRDARLAQGYMDKDKFLAFLRGEEQASILEGKAWYLVLLIVLLGGVAMNLTPCVLPMMPINLMVIGKSAGRGALYGLGIALAYGTMGLLAALGGVAFGAIQGNPWFNLAVAALFVALACSLFGLFAIDFSKARQGTFDPQRMRRLKALFPLVMGIVSAVLAGACVAPILIAVLLLTARLYAGGNPLALGLPFVLGLGMALPWPLAGAGLKVLPKPGAWMAKVNPIFGMIVLGFAAWYGYLSYQGFVGTVQGESAVKGGADAAVVQFAEPKDFSLAGLERPVLVDCWATWCKNCTAMEHSTLADPEVKAELKRRGFTIVKLQAERIGELQQQAGFEGVKGLPAFLIFE